MPVLCTSKAKLSTLSFLLSYFLFRFTWAITVNYPSSTVAGSLQERLAGEEEAIKGQTSALIKGE